MSVDARSERSCVRPTALALEAAVRIGQGSVRLEDVAFQSPLTMEGDVERTIQTVVSQSGGSVEFQILSAPADDADTEADWTLHVAGSIRRLDSAGVPPSGGSLEEARRLCREVPAAEYYEQLAERGIELGAAFRAISQLWIGETSAAAELVVPAESERASYLIHPALFDACCHVLGATIAASAGADETYLLAQLERLTVFSALDTQVWCRDRFRAQDARCARLGVDVLSRWATAGASRGDNSQSARRRGLGAERLDVKVCGSRSRHHVVRRSSHWHPAPHVAATGGQAIASDREAETRATVRARSDRTASTAIHDALRALGWRPRAGDVADANTLRGELGVVPRQAALFRRLLQILAADGVLALDGDRLSLVRGLDSEPAAPLAVSVASKHPIMAAELELTTRCGASLAAVLRGEANPVELLFPGGSLELAERVYEKSGASRVFAQVVEQGVANAVAQHPPERPLRVLEIGGGTGSMTGRVLPLLPAERSQYVFTDVSPVFTTRAQHKFKAFSFVDYRLLDVSRDPIADGFTPHDFDIVLAANVLHANRTSVRPCARSGCFAPGGLLIIESVRASRWLGIRSA